MLPSKSIWTIIFWAAMITFSVLNFIASFTNLEKYKEERKMFLARSAIFLAAAYCIVQWF